MPIDTIGLSSSIVATIGELNQVTRLSHPAINIVQVNGSGPDQSGPDVPAGTSPSTVVRRPKLIQWIAEAGDGSKGILSGQSGEERRRSRLAFRAATDLRYEVHDVLSPALLAEWLKLHQDNRVPHRRDLGLVDFYAKAVDLARSSDILLAWRDGADLVGGCLANVDKASSALRGRFSAVDSLHRGRDLTRAMYVASADVARDFGLDLVTLGADPNMYGPALPTGLLTFKRRLGFKPVPHGLLDSSRAVDVTERIINLDGLPGPVLRLAYPNPKPDAGLQDYLGGITCLELVVDCTRQHERTCQELLPSRLNVHGGAAQ